MARILVVDDEEDMRAALRMFLERSGHSVQEAPDGEAALSTLHAQGADVVLLDMRMPGMDGVQTLTKIRERFKNLPVVMVTGYGSTESVKEVLDLGANHYVSKPFKNQELADALEKVGLQSTAEPAAADAELDDPAAPRKAIPWKVVGAAAGVVLCVGVALGVVFNPNRNYPIPYSNPVSMTWKDGKLWMVDWFTQSIYVHKVESRQLPVIKTYHMPNSHVTGLALVGDVIYTCDPWAKHIQKHKLDEFLTVQRTYQTSNKAPATLFYDGKYLWSCDTDAGKIYQHLLDDSLTVIAEYKAPGPSLAGFFKDSKYAWTTDTKTRKMYQHRLDEQLTVLATYTYEGFDEGSEPLNCFIWNDSKIWYARERKNQIYRRSKGILKLQEKKS